MIFINGDTHRDFERIENIIHLRNEVMDNE